MRSIQNPKSKIQNRERAFTLIELLVVIAIMATLAGLLFAAMDGAKSRAKNEASKAVVNLIAGACNSYWTVYHDFPAICPDKVGTNAGTFTSNALLKSDAKYWNGTSWQIPVYPVVTLYMLSMPRSPEPFLNINQKWFKQLKINNTLAKGPDGRQLYTCEDGFGNELYVAYGKVAGTDPVTSQQIVVDRPWESDAIWYWHMPVGGSTMRITSAGKDGKFGSFNTATGVYEGDDAKDNIEVLLQR